MYLTKQRKYWLRDFGEISHDFHKPLLHKDLHSLSSYDLNIITLLEGERKVKRPIHKPEFYKPLKLDRLLKALDIMKELLKNRG